MPWTENIGSTLLKWLHCTQGHAGHDGDDAPCFTYLVCLSGIFCCVCDQSATIVNISYT